MTPGPRRRPRLRHRPPPRSFRAEPLEGRTLLAAAPLFVPVAAPHDIVVDPLRDALYITTDGGTVEHYDVAGQSLRPALDMGGSPVLGADLTPGGSALYIARGPNAPGNVTHQVISLGAAGVAGGAVTSLPI